MLIKSLELSKYRNYDTLSIEFDKGINILYGDNAQGKTNLLEAIFVCATTKSHRGSKDKEIVNFNSEESHIRITIEKDNIHHKVDMHLRKNKTKGVAINGLPIKKSSDLLGIVHIVFFSPEDLSIIKNGPSERRKFIDFELSQLDKLYLHNLSKYNKIIMQRNNLLKQISFNKGLLDTLNIWDIQLVEYGNKIIESRCRFINDLNEIIYNIHKKLTGNKEDISIHYVPNVNNIEEFSNKLKENRNKDINLKTTHTGPHRDDINFYLKDIDIRKYGSQGQQRTTALSLKLAEIEIVKKTIKENPILLLDDVLSELDTSRQNYLLDSINDIQTIITCTGIEDIINSKYNNNRIFKITEGKVSNQN